MGGAVQTESARRAIARVSGRRTTGAAGAAGPFDPLRPGADFATNLRTNARDAAKPSSLAKNCFREGSWLTVEWEVDKSPPKKGAAFRL